MSDEERDRAIEKMAQEMGLPPELLSGDESYSSAKVDAEIYATELRARRAAEREKAE